MSQIDIGSATNFTSISVPIVSAAATVDDAPSLRRFTVKEYHRLGESGILGGDERLELLEGIITMMTPIGIAHARTVVGLQLAFQRSLPAGWQAITQQPLAFAESEPVPDCFVVRGDYMQFTTHPTASDVGLVIEVADSSLRQDRRTKVRIYAAAGIPEYWIVNLVDKQFEVHRRPVAASGELPARYETIDTLGQEASAAVALDGVQVGMIAVRDVLP